MYGELTKLGASILMAIHAKPDGCLATVSDLCIRCGVPNQRDMIATLRYFQSYVLVDERIDGDLLDGSHWIITKLGEDALLEYESAKGSRLLPPLL